MELVFINGLTDTIWIRYNKRLDPVNPVLEIEIFLANVDADDARCVAEIEAGKNHTFGSNDQMAFSCTITAPPGYLASCNQGKFITDDGKTLPAIKLEELESEKPTN